MESVAIIVPIYNSSRFLRECIESIISQTYQNIEILLINDGSTDSSLDIIKEYELADDRVRSCTVPNSGVSAARNTGISLAKSENIVFVDSDDVIPPFLIEKLIAEKENDFVMCGYETWNLPRNERCSFACPEFEGTITEFCDNIIDYLIPPYLLGPCFKLFKKNIIEMNGITFPLDISFGEDAEFVLTYLEYTKYVKCLSFVGYTYRQYDSATLSKRFRKDKMDIYHRIANHILYLLKRNDSRACVGKVFGMYLQNYVEFSKELFDSSLKYEEKKNLFFKSGISNEIQKCEKEADSLSIAQKMTLFSLKSKVFLPVYLVFRLYDAFRMGLNKV